MSHKVLFYEGGYQYNDVLIQDPNEKANLYAGVLGELNHQYRYRPTDEDLWAEVELSGSNQCHRVIRQAENSALVKIFDEHGKIDQFQFTPTEEYSLVFVNQ